MMQIPGPAREDELEEGTVGNLAGGNAQAMLYSIFAPGFRPFALLLWVVLALALVGFAGLHIVVGWHWVYPESWLTASETAYVEQKVAMLWSRVGGWILPLAYFFWQAVATRRE